MASGLSRVLRHLHLVLAPAGGLADDQLLARFVAVRDEGSFAALVRRHGPMVLAVCRRVLRHEHDAEDAFQAAFLVLAKKAAAVRTGCLGSWLYGVAYRTALAARAAGVRRRARERQVKAMPHPEVAAAEAEDWRPLLDHEMSRLPEKYRAAVVLCDLEGRSRREAARLLGLPEGTLSSRLATARRQLARRLRRYGLALSGGALATVLAEGASAGVPAPLVVSTVRAAVLVAAGQAAALSGPAAALMKGVLKAMLLAKLKVAAAVVMVTAALGAGGVAFRAAAGPGTAHAAAEPDKAPPEVEALRRKVELLQLNLDLVLEKVRAQEAELRGFRERAKAAQAKGQPLGLTADAETFTGTLLREIVVTNEGKGPEMLGVLLRTESGAVQEVEAALKALRAAPADRQARQKAVEALERALKKLREHPGPGSQ
jgi:RNA polymerase sigma factor (sigma-70 family)